MAEGVRELLEDISRQMFRIADEFRLSRTRDVFNMAELGEQVNRGYARAMWCGSRACEDAIKEAFSATSRNMPFDQTPIADKCVCCGEPADKVMYFAKAY